MAETAAVDRSVEEPLPLFRSLPNPEPFPINRLHMIGWAAKAVADVTQAPLALCACSALAAATMVTHTIADVLLPIGDGERRPLSLFLLTICDSGERQSTVDRLLQGPIAKQEGMSAWRRRESGSRLLTYENPTAEELLALLETEQSAISALSTEAGQFIGTNRTSPSRRHAAAGLVPLWDGVPVKWMRAPLTSVIFSARRVSLFLTAPPAVAFPLLNKHRWDGLTARFLVSQPASTIGSRLQRKPALDFDKMTNLYYTQLCDLAKQLQNTVNAGSELVPNALPLDDRARALFFQFADEIEWRMGAGGDLAELRPFASKLAEQAARIAGVLTVFHVPDATCIEGGPSGHMAGGIEIARWFGSEAVRLYGAASPDCDLADAERVRVWLTTKWNEELISVSDLVQYGPPFVRSADRARPPKHSGEAPVGAVAAGPSHGAP